MVRHFILRSTLILFYFLLTPVFNRQEQLRSAGTESQLKRSLEDSQREVAALMSSNERLAKSLALADAKVRCSPKDMRHFLLVH